MLEQRQNPETLTGWARLRPAGTKSHYYAQGRAACKPNAQPRQVLLFPEPNHNLAPCAACLKVLNRARSSRP